MVYFRAIRPDRHYTKHHEKDVPWHKVVEIILTTKNPKKLKDRFRIEKDGYYILFKIKDSTLYVINAKR